MAELRGAPDATNPLNCCRGGTWLIREGVDVVDQLADGVVEKDLEHAAPAKTGISPQVGQSDQHLP